MIAIMGIVMVTATADQSMKENTTITVVTDTIALGPTTENIVGTESIAATETIAAVGTIAVIGHTTGAITAINAFC
ncbi:hypothetical protein EV681_1990 [Advenella incenata]|jgi:hypothetical protein|uniref:Uncharacterized protein n=2 Tax=Advenella incenata TaxID=267800 RepID=A0A4Q7VU77_9BURK|nr:hypothetical protein EV681_1990 [Advenella incenata]